MTDVVLLPIVLMGVLSRDREYVTPIGTYTDAVECIQDLPFVSESYLPDFPEAVFWCANPIGRVGVIDPLSAPDLALEASPRPKPRPENLESELDDE